MDWRRNKDGLYISSDNRFVIIQTETRVYGQHWQLTDSLTGAVHRLCSLSDAKVRAECVLLGAF